MQDIGSDHKQPVGSDGTSIPGKAGMVLSSNDTESMF